MLCFSCLTKNCYESLRLGFFFSSLGPRGNLILRKPENVVILQVSYMCYCFFSGFILDCLWCVIFSNYFQISSFSNQTDIWLSKIRRILLIIFFSHTKIRFKYQNYPDLNYRRVFSVVYGFTPYSRVTLTLKMKLIQEQQQL